MSNLVRQLVTDHEPIARFINSMDGKAKLLDLIETTFITQHTVNGVPNNAAEEDLAMMNIAILNVVKRHSYVSIEELRFVIGQGLTGEYGEMTHFFNAKNVNTWLRKHQEIRRSVVKDLAQKRQEMVEPREVSDEEKVRTRRAVLSGFISWIQKYSQRYSEAKGGGGDFTAKDIDEHFGAAYWYDRLLNAGLMDPPDKADKILAFEGMKQPALLELAARRIGGKPLTTDSPEINSRAKAMAKWYFVKKLMIQWFENDVDFSTLLKESLDEDYHRK